MCVPHHHALLSLVHYTVATFSRMTRHVSSQSNLHPPTHRWQNFELISDRPFETMLSEMKRLKEEYPDRVLIASIMEEYNRGAWEEIIGRCVGAAGRSNTAHTEHCCLCF